MCNPYWNISRSSPTLPYKSIFIEHEYLGFRKIEIIKQRFDRGHPFVLTLRTVYI